MNTPARIGIALAGILALTLGPATCTAKPNPYNRPDQSWISIDGVARDTKPDSFMLDYGPGAILVEMDDWDSEKEGLAIREGDKVSVFGKIDNDLYHERRIEARSVLVKNLGTFFYARAEDEEDFQKYWRYPHQRFDGNAVVKGTVTKVDEHQFTVSNGDKRLVVDVSDMAYDPLDDVGYQKVDVGDVVSVAGNMDIDFWNSKELVAETLVILKDS